MSVKNRKHVTNQKHTLKKRINKREIQLVDSDSESKEILIEQDATIHNAVTLSLFNKPDTLQKIKKATYIERAIVEKHEKNIGSIKNFTDTQLGILNEQFSKLQLKYTPKRLGNFGINSMKTFCELEKKYAPNRNYTGWYSNLDKEKKHDCRSMTKRAGINMFFTNKHLTHYALYQRNDKNVQSSWYQCTLQFVHECFIEINKAISHNDNNKENEMRVSTPCYNLGFIPVTHKDTDDAGYFILICANGSNIDARVDIGAQLLLDDMKTYAESSAFTIFGTHYIKQNDVTKFAGKMLHAEAQFALMIEVLNTSINHIISPIEIQHNCSCFEETIWKGLDKANKASINV